jgi:hypothetical protein
MMRDLVFYFAITEFTLGLVAGLILFVALR